MSFSQKIRIPKKLKVFLKLTTHQRLGNHGGSMVAMNGGGLGGSCL